MSTSASGRLPDFFVVGQAKSGTTALHEMLDQHDQVFMPAVKEPSFFANDLWAPAHAGLALNETSYRALFAGARPEQRIGDASPQYIFSPEAAARIANARPDARIIVMLRDPATFLVSLHLELVQRRVESEPDLRRALALEPERRAGRRIPRDATRPAALMYTERIRYVEQLARFETWFPPKQMLVLIYEDFATDNATTVRRIFEFIGVDGEVAVTRVQANPTVRVRSAALDRALHAVTVGDTAVGAALKSLVTTVVPRSARRHAVQRIRRNMYAAPGGADEGLLGELRVRFRPEVDELGARLGQDLISRWGYDQRA